MDVWADGRNTRDAHEMVEIEGHGVRARKHTG